jgi:hypothetical protein
MEYNHGKSQWPPFGRKGGIVIDMNEEVGIKGRWKTEVESLDYEVKLLPFLPIFSIFETFRDNFSNTVIIHKKYTYSLT